MNLKEIRAAITGLKTRYVNANEAAQTIAIAIVRHAQEHGDCSEAPRLVRALPARLRNMMVAYFSNVSPIGIRLGKTAADDAVKLVQTTNKNYHPFDLGKAEANKWYDDPFHVNPPEKGLDTLTDFRENVQKFIDRTLKAVKDGKFAENAIEDVTADIEAIRKAAVARCKAVATPAMVEMAAPTVK